MKAQDILEAAAGHMKDRAATYDKPDGERSIGATVAAFNAVTGDGLMNNEERGWLFMSILKMVRSQQGNYKADNYEDLSAYGALMGEAAREERNGGWSPEAIKQAAFPSEIRTETGESAHGEQVDDGWIEWAGGECPVGPETMVEVETRGVQTGRCMAREYGWGYYLGDGDIIRYRVV